MALNLTLTLPNPFPNLLPLELRDEARKAGDLPAEVRDLRLEIGHLWRVGLGLGLGLGLG